MIRALAAALSCIALASCSLVYWPDDIAPTDAVKTEADAIKLADKNCGPPRHDPERDHWDAHLEGGTWIVHWSNRQSSIDVEIDKKDGGINACDQDIVPE